MDFETAKGVYIFNNGSKVCESVIKASKEMIWLYRFMDELGKKKENSRLYNDSQSVFHLANRLSFHSNTKHIQLKYHFIRSFLEENC